MTTGHVFCFFYNKDVDRRYKPEGGQFSVHVHRPTPHVDETVVRFSVHKKYRRLIDVVNERLGATAQHDFAHAAATITAHDDQVGTTIPCRGQQRTCGVDEPFSVR